MTKAVSITETGNVATVHTRESVLAAFIEQLMTIPAPDGDGWGMIGTILESESWEDLQDEASKLPNAREVAGKQLKVNNIERLESTIENEDGLPYYLLIDSTDVTTGERVMWQTSARSVTAKLVRLFIHGVLPAVVETRVSTTATKAGFFPVNLIVHAVTPA